MIGQDINREEESVNISQINSEEALPPEGNVISATGEELELPESQRNEFCIYELGGGKRQVWLLVIKDKLGKESHMQIKQDIKKKDYKIAKTCLVTHNVLLGLYERKLSKQQQKATGDDSAAVKQFETILTYAIAEKASDIHIEVTPSGGVIRMRIKSEVVPYNAEKRLSYDEAYKLCSVIYTVLASTKDVTFEPRDCQQAAVPYTLGDQQLKLRYQSVPAYPDGFDVILRVLLIGRSEEFTPLSELGYSASQEKQLIHITSRSVGALIIAGVTGSGKSTTLKNLLMHMNANSGYRRKIYSIEDPPEYTIPRITQIPVVQSKATEQNRTSPFEKPIKACMRGDPDVIMIGEVRDVSTGDLTKKAVQSGHQVLTTVHATSALGILPRFEDFNVGSSVLGSPDFLNGLLYQKLVKIVCPKCSHDFNQIMQDVKNKKHTSNVRITQNHIEVYEAISNIVNPLAFPLKLRNHSGCKVCKFSGIQKLSVCAEVITLDLEMIEKIEQKQYIALKKYWRELSDKKPDSENMQGKTCMEHGFYKVLKGLTCPIDLVEAFEPLELMYDSNYQKELTKERQLLWEKEKNPLAGGFNDDSQDNKTIDI
jgi:hypothetical protein